MSVKFHGWEVVDDGASFPGVVLGPSQKPQNRGVYTMYHGTSIDSARLIIANGFKQSSNGLLGSGVYVSRDTNKASNYPYFTNPSERVVLEVRVRVGRVKRIDSSNHPMRLTWQANGYDTAWVPANTPQWFSGLQEDCVFDPKRVKVVGISKAANTSLQKELQQLIAKQSQTTARRSGGGAAVCSLCKRKTQQDSQHIKERCWKCGENICILMSKHLCSASP
ncbi:uncharacterized protein LOC125011627 [Mugil cephalus]|uniref:uncharacterized protein LOC125011627 n=1 Tax=Mugil cephalus TaxID=48193 RepID=UPI001FB725AE|nr:uncharacterized protein LOC125011627 [Mugil cephalus]XP_047446803.1 uncharacterized protein LOC125011627 [Mugil cephalus]